MAEPRGPDGPDESMAAAVDLAAAALLSVCDGVRERASNQLSASQLRAVMVVERHDGINLRGLAGICGMLLSSASRLCDRLVAAGMLEREPGRIDRREISLHLTPMARAFLDELRAERRERLGAVLAGMNAESRRALLRGLTEFARASAVIEAEARSAGGQTPGGPVLAAQSADPPVAGGTIDVPAPAEAPGTAPVSRTA